MAQAASLTMAHDALLPRPPGGNGPGAALALVVHAGLLLALTTSVDWRSETPDAVSAELWASVPQAAAPKPVEVAPLPPAPPAPQPVVPAPAPPPQAAPLPPEPDIALERAQRRKAEAARKKADADAEAERLRVAAAERKRTDDEARKKREQAQQEVRQAKAEDERLARQREENLRRMMGQAGAAATGAAQSTGTAARDAAPSAAYLGQLAARIRRELVYTGTVPDNVAAEVEVRAAPGGTIISRRLAKTSGHKDWDEAVLRAIDKTSHLPPDTDGRVPTWLTIVFKPQE